VTAPPTAGRPTVLLHLGEPKSGTTYLQELVWNNRSLLRRHGLHLPGHAQGDHFRASMDLRQVPRESGDPAPSWAGEWAALARAALRPVGTALITQEHLCGATAEQAQHAVESLGGADVHVILTVRDFVSLLPAEWQETVKHRNGRPWPAWLKDIRRSERRDVGRPRARWFWSAHDTPAVLARWARLLPADHIHVVTVPRTRTRPTLLWERFASVLGVEAAGVDTSSVRSNATLGLVETELLRRFNLRLPAEVPLWFYGGAVKEHLAHEILAERPRSSRPTLPEDVLPWAQGRCDVVVEAIRAAGYDVVGDLDDLRAPDAVAATTPPPTNAELLDAALDTLAALVRDEYRDHTRRWRFRTVKAVSSVAGGPQVRRAARLLGGRG
jgi:hypothetical protein